jgi:hypothetical protein
MLIGRTRRHGDAAGALLGAAVLTTPRTYPFGVGFLCAGGLLACTSPRRRHVLQPFAAAVAVLAAVGVTWAIAAHGTPLKWLQYLAFIATHENTDVAVLPTAIRDWAFNRTGLITPVFALAGTGLAALRHVRSDEEDSNGTLAMRFTLVTGWIAFVITVCLLNFTLGLNTYSVLPLFVIVIALPLRSFEVLSRRNSRRVLAGALTVLLAGDAFVAIRRYVPVAATWEARDPDRVVTWLRARIPAGADVIGPNGAYFFVAEEAGARYFWTSEKSWSDWSRWVRTIDPAAVGMLPRSRPLVGRYLIWFSGEPLPRGYTCAASHLVDVILRRRPAGWPVSSG